MAWRSLGGMLRSVGAAIDGAGAALQGRYAYRETLSRHQTLQPFEAARPKLGDLVFVAPNASLVGDVTIGTRSSVWYGAVLRGDVNSIQVGKNTNIQDNVIMHVAKHNPQGASLPTIIGDDVTIGHAATIHACTVEDGSLVGMGATLLDGVKVQQAAIVAAGALVTPGTTVPSGEIWAGNPAKLLRRMDEEERDFILQSADNYAALAEVHAAENGKTALEVERDSELREDRQMRSPDYDSHLGIERDPITREITNVSGHT